MKSFRTIGVVLTAAAGVLATGCSNDLSTAGGPDGSIRVVNASPFALNVYIDDRAVGQVLPVSGVSASLPVSRGLHQVQLMSPSGATTALTVETSSGKTATAVAVSNGGSVAASILADTGSVVPIGKSKLRVAHYASGQQVEFWRTQPDWPTPVHIMTPFGYQATSPYLQSDPGSWEVFVTAPGGGAKLATTGSVTVPSGERRTVVLVDSVGVLRFRVISE